MRAEPTPHVADENVAPPRERAYELVSLVRQTHHDLAGVTRVRLRGPGKGHLDVDGLGLAHALRRMALHVEQQAAVGDLEVTEPRRVALRALVHASEEIWRLSKEARWYVAECRVHRLKLDLERIDGDETQPMRPVIDELGAAMTALRTDLAYEEG